MPESDNVDIKDTVCSVTTDDILNPDGFDLKLGEQVFHFNMRNNPKLTDIVNAISPVGGIPNHIYDECFAVLNCENNNYKGFREILEEGSAKSRDCRYYSACDFYSGKDGGVDGNKAFQLLVNTPWGGYDETLRWIDNPKKKKRAAEMCYFYDAKSKWIKWNNNGNIIEVLNLEGKQKFIEICAECYQQLGMEGDKSDYDVNNYGVYLWEKGEKKQALPFLKACADEGSIKACYEVGVLYMFGFYDSNHIKSPHIVPKENLLVARDYLEKSVGNGIYDDEEYAYLSLLYWLVGDTPNAERNDKIGAEKKFSISVFKYGMRLYEQAKKEHNGKLLLIAEKYLTDGYRTSSNIYVMHLASDACYRYTSNSMKHPYWLREAGNSYKEWVEKKQKVDEGLVRETVYWYRNYPESNWWLK